MSPQLIADIREFYALHLDSKDIDGDSDKEVIDAFIMTCDSLSPIVDMMKNFKTLYGPDAPFSREVWMHDLLDLHERLMEEMLFGDVTTDN